jgi:hypothetical protein
LPYPLIKLAYHPPMNPTGDLVAAVAPALTDLGVVSVSGLSMVVPGDRGDSILVNFERLASPVADSEEFLVHVSNHLVPWTAYQRDVAPAQVRAAPAEDYSEGVYWVRLTWRSSRSLPEIWEVTPETRTAVAADLSREIRRALEEDWLPILPRTQLRAQIRDPERKGMSWLRNQRITDLMCGIEDLTENDLRDLMRFFRSRMPDDLDLQGLANWIERSFLTG